MHNIIVLTMMLIFGLFINEITGNSAKPQFCHFNILHDNLFSPERIFKNHQILESSYHASYESAVKFLGEALPAKKML